MTPFLLSISLLTHPAEPMVRPSVLAEVAVVVELPVAPEPGEPEADWQRKCNNEREFHSQDPAPAVDLLLANHVSPRRIEHVWSRRSLIVRRWEQWPRCLAVMVPVCHSWLRAWATPLWFSTNKLLNYLLACCRIPLVFRDLKSLALSYSGSC